MKNHKLPGLLLFLAAIATNAYGQSDTTFIDSTWHKIARSKASFYKIMKRNTDDPTRLINYVYDMNGRLKHEVCMLEVTENGRKPKQLRDGISKEWDDNGKLKKEVEYKKDKVSGRYTSYWNNETIKRIETYFEGKSTGGTCYDHNGKKLAYFPIQLVPEYPGGEKALINYIGRQIHYPLVDQKNEVQGTVLVQFSVTKQGNVGQCKIVRSLSTRTNAEAIRIISSLTNWIPATDDDGKPIDFSFFTIPIVFRLENNQTENPSDWQNSAGSSGQM